MGSQPCEQDCAVFGQLSQLNWQMPGPAGEIFKGEHSLFLLFKNRDVRHVPKVRQNHFKNYKDLKSFFKFSGLSTDLL